MFNNITSRQTRCNSIVPTKYPVVNPYINSLSSSYSVVGATTLLTIFGTNFRDFSSVRFGSTEPLTIFISSSQISFYVPSTLSFGTYPIQVFNDNLGSNVVDFTIDDNGNYWQLSAFDFSIFNSNNGGVNMGKSSVNAKFIQSNSIPGAHLYYPDFIPIYSSISDFSDIYSYPNSNPKVTISVGTSTQMQLPKETYNKYSFIVSPGYKLVVRNNHNVIVLDIENLYTSGICCNPTPVALPGSYLTSCDLYFYSNNTWVKLQMES